MVDRKSKTKIAMLLELESIKGLLHEEDGIPILQEIIEPAQGVAAKPSISPEITSSLTGLHSNTRLDATHTTLHSEQQDFFETSFEFDSATTLLDKLSDLEKATAGVTAPHTATTTAIKPDTEAPKNPLPRPVLAKATGENPFLPEHIRARLHGNNPPPLFELEAAQKISRVSRPKTFLGSTDFQATPVNHKITLAQQTLINDIMDNLLPEIERELRERLEAMTKEMLEELLARKP